MNEPSPGGNERKPSDWAPYDLTDGKEKGTWKTVYPQEARKYIRWETAYLIILAIISLVGVFWVIWESDFYLAASDNTNNSAGLVKISPIFLGFLGSLFAGTLGGCSFGIKCMYHFVAKLMWHEDRRLWRLLSPPLSGILSLFMVFLVASGLLQIFDSKFIEQPIRVMAFSFLVGYFSDKALAKMAEVADTLFGGTRQ